MAQLSLLMGLVSLSFCKSVRKGLPLPDTFPHHTDCTGLADLKETVLCVE